jgi:transcriptional regulator GlxA family with amidase domain
MLLHLPVATPIRDSDGVAVCRPGDCILLDPGFPHWHEARDVPIRNDWFWARSRDLGAVAAALGLPVNRRFHPRSTDAVAPALTQVIAERQRQATAWQRRIALLVEDLLIDLARQLALASAPGDERLREVRVQVQARLAEPWTVARMAQLAGLGSHRFAVAYRRLFGVPPLEDLLRSRIQVAAQALLLHPGDVAGAARRAGFRDLPWFSRCFRARLGHPPSRHGVRPAGA